MQSLSCQRLPSEGKPQLNDEVVGSISRPARQLVSLSLQTSQKLAKKISLMARMRGRLRREVQILQVISAEPLLKLGKVSQVGSEVPKSRVKLQR